MIGKAIKNSVIKTKTNVIRKMFTRNVERLATNVKKNLNVKTRKMKNSVIKTRTNATRKALGRNARRLVTLANFVTEC